MISNLSILMAVCLSVLVDGLLKEEGSALPRDLSPAVISKDNQIYFVEWYSSTPRLGHISAVLSRVLHGAVQFRAMNQSDDEEAKISKQIATAYRIQPLSSSFTLFNVEPRYGTPAHLYTMPVEETEKDVLEFISSHIPQSVLTLNEHSLPFDEFIQIFRPLTMPVAGPHFAKLRHLLIFSHRSIDDDIRFSVEARSIANMYSDSLVVGTVKLLSQVVDESYRRWVVSILKLCNMNTTITEEIPHVTKYKVGDKVEVVWFSAASNMAGKRGIIKEFHKRGRVAVEFPAGEVSTDTVVKVYAAKRLRPNLQRQEPGICLLDGSRTQSVFTHPRYSDINGYLSSWGVAPSESTSSPPTRPTKVQVLEMPSRTRGLYFPDDEDPKCPDTEFSSHTFDGSAFTEQLSDHEIHETY
eukprot:TRINITY_DN20852_c0_g1_i1.p1 TRINITY_DN20852_c0_g1~~TRINITY_DN20852_c0_g1_i1.p1  ORF type:complete len:411 (+),score=66.63 TRINITY_DN20852_c0_g1_i1:64-1296(+)